jgi:hypothetical protein
MLEFTDPLHIPYRRRANPQEAAELGRPGNPDAPAQSPSSLGDPQRQVVLTDNRLTQREIMAGMTTDDPAQRAAALNAIRDTAQVVGDLVTGNTTVRLSESGLFPPDTRGGIPTAVSIGDEEREQVDTRWTGLFDGSDNRQQTDNLLFRIEDVYHAIAFERYERGERIQMSHVEGGDETYEAYYYAAGLQYNSSWADFNPHSWSRDDSVAAMQRRYLRKQMKRAYAVLTDSTGLTTQSYVDDDDSGSVSVQNDVATINAGMNNILSDLFNQTSPQSGEAMEEVPDNPQFALLFNNLTQGYRERIQKALSATFNATNDELAVAELDFPVEPIGTPHVPTGNWWLVMPGRKNVAAQFRDLQTFDIMDPRVVGVNEGQVGQGIFRMVRGDNRQVQELATS